MRKKLMTNVCLIGLNSMEIVQWTCSVYTEGRAGAGVDLERASGTAIVVRVDCSRPFRPHGRNAPLSAASLLAAGRLGCPLHSDSFVRRCFRGLLWRLLARQLGRTSSHSRCSASRLLLFHQSTSTSIITMKTSTYIKKVDDLVATSASKVVNWYNRVQFWFIKAKIGPNFVYLVKICPKFGFKL